MDLEDFCHDFYDTQILNPVLGNVDVGNTFSEWVQKDIAVVYAEFSNLDPAKLNEEIRIMRFELFALAWTHKFVSGTLVVAQSDFTKRYLEEKGRNETWAGMEPYNNMIDSVTLHWLASLGTMNLSFNNNMRESLTKENTKSADELAIDNDDRIERANHRLWSENAWKQDLMLGPLVFTFCEQLGIDADDLNREAQLQLAEVIRGLYEGAQQAWGEVRIKRI